MTPGISRSRVFDLAEDPAHLADRGALRGLEVDEELAAVVARDEVLAHEDQRGHRGEHDRRRRDDRGLAVRERPLEHARVVRVDEAVEARVARGLLRRPAES